MNRPTTDHLAPYLLTTTQKIFSILTLVFLIGIKAPVQGQDSLHEIIQDNRRQIDDLTRQLYESKKQIALLTQRNDSRSGRDAIIAEELYMLQQGVYDLGNRLKRLREIVNPPTTRSDYSPVEVQQYLDRFEQKIREIEDNLQRINKTSTLIRTEIPRYNLEEENRELIQNSFRAYYSSFPSPSSQLIRLDRAYARDIHQLYFEFNVRDKNSLYAVSIRNASGFLPEFRGEQVSLRGKLAWKRKSCRLSPGRYTVVVHYKGKSISSYSFTLL